MRVIIQEVALKKSEGHPYHHFIHELPTIDAAPIVHARWEDAGMYYLCTNCKRLFRDEIMFIQDVDYNMPNYCPMCGAKMDGGAD